MQQKRPWVAISLLPLLFILTWFGSAAAGSCDFVVGSRPTLGNQSIPECPYYSIDTALTYNYTALVWNGTATVGINSPAVSVNGSLGWCATGYTYPVTASFPGYGIGSSYGDDVHSFYMNIPLPWCVFTTVYSKCIAPRPDNWHPPSILTNLRPLGPLGSTNGTCFNNTFKDAPDPYGVPTSYPLWDEGGYYTRTHTLNIMDSCIDSDVFFFATKAAAANFLILAANATFQSPAVGDTSGLVHWWGTMQNANPAFAPNINIPHATCRGDCPAFFNVSCNGVRNASVVDRFTVGVELACRDSIFGYMWRIVNAYGGPNLHMDWEIVRALENETVHVSPVGGITQEVFFPTDLSMRMFWMASDDDMFETELWPNATQKHGSAAGTFFYLPTYIDMGVENNTASAALLAERPSILKLYAGFPDHYTGTVAVGALVAFYNVESLFNLPLMRSLSIVDAAVVDGKTRFPGDRPRQTLLALCGNATAVATAASYLVPANLTFLCGLINDANTTWPVLLNATYENFFFNETLVDPVPACTCNQVPCEPGNVSPGASPRILYDYTALTPPPAPNVTVEPVCRMDNTSIGLFLANLPPQPDLNGNPGDYLTVPLVSAPWLNRLVPPFYISGPLVTYETSPLGVLWRINNNNNYSDPIRFEFGEYTPPSGLTAGAIITVPFAVASPMDVSLGALKSLWVFSRTTNPHKLYGNVQVGCATPAQCAAAVPQDPPLLAWGPARIIYAEFDDASTLPPCECYVNFPCNGALFVGKTPVNVNVTELEPPSTPFIQTPVVYAPIYPNCTPTPEICNGLDDDCNGIVDDPPGIPGGIGNPCSTFFTAGACAANPGTLACNLTSGDVVCIGQVPPTEELCDSLDHNCDGILGNVPGLGEVCGSDIGICVPGILTCVLGNVTAQCVGGVRAEPAEICGDGLDDDCNGLIDDGCPPTPPVITIPAVSPSPTMSTPPGKSATPTPHLQAPPPLTFQSVWDRLLEAIGFTLTFGPYNIVVLILLAIILATLCVVCGILVCRQDMVRRRVRRSNGYEEMKQD